jgi:dTDP-4-amino-4,6-dideoxygalactose transaminase
MIDVPVADPRSGLIAARDDLREAFERVLESGSYILGREVEAFEREWAASCSAGHAVGIDSGTDALALALRAVGVEPGHEVLVPAMTAVATWMAVAQIGAVPVGVDIDAERRCIDPAKAVDALSANTRAIVAVHLFGQPADVDELSQIAAIPVVEDAAQAHGATVGERRVGSLTACAAFSFYPTKNLGAMGDAGAVTTSDAELADRVRLLREYGWRTRGDSELKGVNARLDELQAALLRVLLTRLDAANERRAAIASDYSSSLADLDELVLPGAVAGTRSAWHLYVVSHPRRDALAAALAEAGVGSGVHYSPPPHLTSAFRADGWAPGDFPLAERHAETALSLPLHPGLTDAQVERVIAAIRDACSKI